MVNTDLEDLYRKKEALTPSEGEALIAGWHRVNEGEACRYCSHTLYQHLGEITRESISYSCNECARTMGTKWVICLQIKISQLVEAET